VKHHYIPQFYLKEWQGRDGKLQMFWRRPDGIIDTKRLFRKATGYAVDLYRLPGVTKEAEQKVESSFMQMVDDQAVRARDHLLGDTTPTAVATRHAWARFVLSLVVRNPEELQHFKDSFQADLLRPSPEFQRRYEEARQVGDPPRFEDWLMLTDPTHPERSAMLAMTNLIVNPSVLELFRKMHWTVWDTSSVQRRLMTSDRPVMMTQGMVQHAGHYALPISPTRLFIATTSVQFAESFSRRPVGKIVRQVNELMIGQARKFVYAVDDTNLAEVRRGMGKMEAPSLLRALTEQRAKRDGS